MVSWIPTDAEVLGTETMHFDQEDQVSYAGRDDQEASDWKIKGPNMLEEEMDPEMEPSLDFQSGGLTLPPMIGSTAWASSGADQTHQKDTSRLSMSIQIQDN